MLICALLNVLIRIQIDYMHLHKWVKDILVHFKDACTVDIQLQAVVSTVRVHLSEREQIVPLFDLVDPAFRWLKWVDGLKVPFEVAFDRRMLHVQRLWFVDLCKTRKSVQLDLFLSNWTFCRRSGHTHILGRTN